MYAEKIKMTSWLKTKKLSIQFVPFKNANICFCFLCQLKLMSESSNDKNSFKTIVVFHGALECFIAILRINLSKKLLCPTFKRKEIEIGKSLQEKCNIFDWKKSWVDIFPKQTKIVEGIKKKEGCKMDTTPSHLRMWAVFFSDMTMSLSLKFCVKNSKETNQIINCYNGEFQMNSDILLITNWSNIDKKSIDIVLNSKSRQEEIWCWLNNT